MLILINLSNLSVKFILKIPIVVMSSYRDKPNSDVMCMPIPQTSIVMLVLHKYFAILSSLHSSRTMLTVRRMFRCYRSRSTLSAVFSCPPLRPPTATARTGLLSSQDQRSFHVLLPADRCEVHLGSFREFSTSSSTRSDAIGKIQSTHYHLIYTCKVPVPVLGRYYR